MTDLHRLIYVSRAVNGSDVDLWVLTSILNAAERNNLQHGLTGLLLAHDGAFCQVLEGSRGAIDGLMGILVHDRRHADIRILCDTPIEARIFDRWAMSQVIVTADLVGDLTGVKIADFRCEGALALMSRAADRMTASV